jgi:UDP-GlcNAc3NAcA epimerase
MKIVSIVGARPQFVKAAVVSRALRLLHTEILVHTGQHYDTQMSDVFFEELEIPTPHYNLAVGSGPHGAQTGAMLAGIEEALQKEQPDWVVVYGDTNSTLAGALAAAKLHFPIVHVESGLRSFNRRMPEEINRIVTDAIADVLLCPSRTALENLKSEGRTTGVHLMADLMAEALAFAVARGQRPSRLLAERGLPSADYLLATVHRAENTDQPDRLRSILSALGRIGSPVVLPLHPRTRQAIETFHIHVADSIKLVEPVSYFEMVALSGAAMMILTDSGGLQKEAYWLGVPCITLRDETEWIETVETGWNKVTGADAERIVTAVRQFRTPAARPALYQEGGRAADIVNLLEIASTREVAT